MYKTFIYSLLFVFVSCWGSLAAYPQPSGPPGSGEPGWDDGGGPPGQGSNLIEVTDYNDVLGALGQTRLSPHGLGLFGESIDTASGSLNFSHTDIVVPGNSSLPVSIGRHRERQAPTESSSGFLFGDWFADIPYFNTTVPAANRHGAVGWKQNRCSASTLGPGTATTLRYAFAEHTYFRGLHLNLPGQGKQLVMKRPGSVPHYETAGQPVLTTKGNVHITCISSIGAGQGEGFIAIAPSGHKYTFDHLVYRNDLPLGGDLGFIWSPGNSPPLVDTLPLFSAFMFASRVEDANGNWVEYDWSGPRLTRIRSNDGREISFTYKAGTDLIETATANGRIWRFQYNNLKRLTRVTLPDNRYWDIQIGTFGYSRYGFTRCDVGNAADVSTMKHPDGANATFRSHVVKFGRKNVPSFPYYAYHMPDVGGELSHRMPRDQQGGQCDDEPAQIVKRRYYTSALTSKEIAMPGHGTDTWSYTYEQDDGGWINSSSGLNDTRTTTVVDPLGGETKYFHNRVYDWREGQLEKVEVRDPNGTLLETRVYDYEVGAWAGTSFLGMFFSQLSTDLYFRETKGKERRINRISEDITRNGYTVSNRYEYNTSEGTTDFSYGYPVRKESWASNAPQKRITDTEYDHRKQHWIIGLPKTITRNGKVFDALTYDSKGQRTQHHRFGALWAKYGYHSDGNVAWAEDALARRTTYSSYKRGLPRTIGYPDGNNRTLVVDNDGRITSDTDPRSNTTSYSYNSSGWLTAINRPGGWANTTISYSGLGTGPVQTITRGNSRTVVTYDAFLRPTLTKSEDLTGTAAARFVRTSYDALGRRVFTSLPSASSTSASGITTSYDALGRVIQTRETVAPFATTSTSYLSGNKIRVTDPSGAQTTTTYQSYNHPGAVEPMQMLDATGTTTSMTRDIYGNITSLSQSSGLNGYSVNVNRQFWYDSRLRLCRHRAPEFGDELFAYDDANQLTMSSRGEATGSNCGTPSAALRTSFTYDAMGRQKRVYYPSGTADIYRTYDANGNLTAVNRGGINWTYRYNDLDLMDRETLQIDGRFYLIDHNYNPTGHLTSRRNADGSTVNMSPNGFGEPRELRIGSTSYASGISYHPSGAVASASYGNGRTYTQTLTPRLLPYDIRVQGAGGTLVNLRHGYDARSKITAITDYVTPTNSRSFTYDPRGRLLTANGSWGTGSFKYDGLDNIRQKRLGSRYVDIAYNGTTNLVSSATDTAVAGTRTYTHDPRGNVTNTGPVQLTYDQANQPTSMTVSGSTNTYTYDGNLKRVKSVQDGKTTYWVYSALTGTPLYQDEVTDNIQTTYMAAGGVQVRLKSGVAEYTHLDHQGSPIAATGATGTALWTDRYTPFGEKLSDPSANRNDVGYTGHVQDDTSGLTYMQARYYDPVIGRFLSTDPIGYQDQLNLYAYVANDPVNHTDPTGMFCIKKNTFCSRKERYQKLARDPQLRKITVFPAAAATTLDTLDTPRSWTGYSKSSVQWLEGLSANLEVENNKVFSALKAGQAVPGITDSPDGIDRGMVRFEQGLVQNALSSLEASDPALYDQVVSETNSVFENYGWGSNAIQAAERKLGHSPNFANQSDREQIGYETVRTESAFSCVRGDACDARSYTSE